MEALHLRAEPETIIKILKLVNKASQDGQEVETFEHDKTWDNLLETFA